MKKIGFIKIFNDQDVFETVNFSLEEETYLYKTYQKYSVNFDMFNFDNMTINDLLDDIEFSDYDSLVFIINNYSMRFEKIVDYINEYLEDINIVIYNQTSNNNLLIESKLIDFNFSFEVDIKIKERIQNSYEAVFQGVYGYKENIHIKHIYIENLKDINELHDTVFLNTSINSLIIFDKNYEESLTLNKYVFSKIISSEKFLTGVKKVSFSIVSSKEIEDNINKFVSSGIVNSDGKLIRDFGKKYFSKSLYSLFIKDGSIYYDSLYSEKISNNLNIGVYELLNNIKNIESDKKHSELLISNYYLALICSFNQKCEIRVISSEVNGEIKKVEDIVANNFKDWFAFEIQKNDESYLVHKLSRRLFKINKEFANVYEHIIKNSEDKIDISLIEEVKRSLANVK